MRGSEELEVGDAIDTTERGGQFYPSLDGGDRATRTGPLISRSYDSPAEMRDHQHIPALSFFGA